MTSQPADGGAVAATSWLRGSLPEAVVRQSPDAIIVTDAEYTVRVWNPAAETTYGIPAGDALNRPLGELLVPYDLNGEPIDVAQARAELARIGGSRRRLLQRPLVGRLVGHEVIVDSVTSVMPPSEREPGGALMINRDVTATARLESEIAALGSLVVATDRARTKAEVAAAALDILCRATGAEAGLVTSTESTYEATARVGVAQSTIDVILSYGQLGGPLAQALEAPDSYISADVATAPLREDVREAVLADGIAHLIVVGLRLSGRLTGILALGWRQGAPHEPSRTIMHQAAALIASSLENARLLDAVESGLREERLLTKRMRALVELTRLPESASAGEFDTTRMLQDVRQLLGADSALYARVEGDHLVLAGMADPAHEVVRPLVERPLDQLPMMAQLAAGATALLAPVDGPLISVEGAAAISARGYRTMAIFALHEAGALVGIVFVAFRRSIDEVELDDRTLDAIGRVLDISFANRRLREVVSASERRYRDLFEYSPEALTVQSQDLVVVDANPAARRLYGGEVVGRGVAELVDGDFIPVDLSDAPHGIARRSNVGRRLDGSTFPQEVELRAIDIGGEPHVLAITRDLTERSLMQAELVQAQKMEAIGLLVAGVAHELNNPLASIVAFSQLLRSDPTLPADLRTQADMLVQEANRTRVIVQNLLDFARQRPPERVPTPLRPLIESVLGLQSYVLSRNRLTVETDMPADLPALLVDRSQIQQVLINLTFNSAQAIRESGRPGTIRIVARATAGEGQHRVRISLADDGPGVPAEVADRLFMPFVTTKEPGEGTGLGLSVSFGIVTGHGGSLRHEPSPGGGATFVMELPSEAAAAPATALGSSAAADPSPRLDVPAKPASETEPEPVRILVLDDEPSIREFLGRVLTRYGYEPVLTSSGPAALEVIRKRPPSGILCDHRMAGMSGTEFHAAVSEIEPALSRRFAFMSGDVLNPELRDFAQARGVHLLAKPFDLGTVDTVVRKLLEEPAAST